MGFVQLGVRNGIEPVRVHSADLRRAFDTVGGSTVRRYIECLVRVVRIVKVIRAEDLVLGVQVVVPPAEDRAVANGVVTRKALISVLERGRKSRRLEEINKHQALTIRAGRDRRIRNVAPRAEHWIRYGASRPDGHAQILAREVFANALPGGEEEEFVFDERAAEAASELVAAKTVKRLPVGGRRRQGFCPEVFEDASM